jgi:hypothetical protein
MAHDPTLPLLSALVSRLRASIPVASLVGARAYEAVPPQETLYPFISVGGWTDTDAGEKDVPGDDTTFVINCWSRAGTKETAMLADAVRATLHEQSLTVLGFQAVFVRHASTVYMLDPDGKTYHAAATYRILTTTVS